VSREQFQDRSKSKPLTAPVACPSGPRLTNNLISARFVHIDGGVAYSCTIRPIFAQKSSVSPKGSPSQRRKSRADSRRLLFDIVKMSTTVAAAPPTAVVLWRKKRFTTEARRFSTRKDVHGRKIPCYSLITSMCAGTGLQKRPVAQGLDERGARTHFSNSLLNSLIAGNSDFAGRCGKCVRWPVSRVLFPAEADRWPFLWDVRCRTPRATYPDRYPETDYVRSLFGLAPGGACRAAFVAEDAVRSYRTISTLPDL